MRILMLDNEFPPLGGGTGIVNQRVLEEFSKTEDVAVDLVTSSCTGISYEDEEMSPRILIHKVPVNTKCLHHSSDRELLTYAIRGYLRCIRLARGNQYDVCFAFAGVPAGAMAYLFSLTHHVPYVVSLQGADVPGFEHRYRYHYLILTPVIKLIWRNASALIACSERLKRLALKTDPDARVVVIGNGVDTHMFRPRRERQREENGSVNILTTGRLIERKGHRFLLQAAAMLHERGYSSIKVHIAGAGDSEDGLKKMCRDLNLEHSVEFLGRLSREQVIAAYEKADIFALPSVNEGMSIALLEALAAGLPVVVTAAGAARQMVRGNGIIVPKRDAGALADALASMIDSPKLRQEMGERSEELAGEFSWGQISRQYLAVCRQAAQKIVA